MTEKTGLLKVCGNVQGNFQSTWIIERFSSLDSQVGKGYNSETFQLENEGIQWLLILYPGGDRETSRDHVCCYVDIIKSERKVNVKYIISLRNTGGEVLLSFENDILKVLELGIGRSKLIQRKSLLEKLVNDTLLVCVEVSHCLTTVKSAVGIDYSVEISPSLSLADDLRKLWKSKENADCVIAVGDEDIPVHSVILGARSKVLAAMFKHETKEKDARRVEVTDFEKDVINSMMEFVYTGSVHGLDFDRALELLRASDKYEIGNSKFVWKDCLCIGFLLNLVAKQKYSIAQAMNVMYHFKGTVKKNTIKLVFIRFVPMAVGNRNMQVTRDTNRHV